MKETRKGPIHGSPLSIVKRLLYSLDKRLGLVDSLVRSLGYEILRLKNAFDSQRMLLSDIPVKTIFDLGANVGDTIAEYRKRFSSALIYGFEPLPEELIGLRKRFKDDSLVKLIPLAVSDEVDKTQFFVNNVRTSSSLFLGLEESKTLFDIPDVVKTVDKIEVSTTTIDDFCKQESIDEIGIPKMDIQGGELAALKGATEMLNSGSILLIYSEILFVPVYKEQPPYYEICSFLFDYGYRLFDWYNLYHSDNRRELVQGDAIFISPRIRGLKDSK